MKFQLVSIEDRLPDFNKLKHPLDTIVFYDRNGVKFLFNKRYSTVVTQKDWLIQGFTHWLEEIDE